MTIGHKWLTENKGRRRRIKAIVCTGYGSSEFEFERVPENVADAVKRLQVEYPVASIMATWPRNSMRTSTGFDGC